MGESFKAPLYGQAMADAMASGDLLQMKQVAADAELYVAENGDIAQLFEILKFEIAMAEARR